MTNRRLGRVVRTIAAGVAALVTLGAAATAQAQALPAGGGEPGKVYMEQQRAIKAKDIPALKKVMSAARVKEMDDPKFKEMLDMVAEMMATDVKVTGGTQTGDTATLHATGKMGTEPQKGEISMVKEAGAWKVDKESWKN